MICAFTRSHSPSWHGSPPPSPPLFSPAWWSDPATALLQPGATPHDYSPATLGQLKHVAKPFYDRFAAMHYKWNNPDTYGIPNPTYPWSVTTGPANAAPATLGQLKFVFSFGFSQAFLTKDTDSDGLPDWHEFLVGASITNADSDGDGWNDLFEVQAGSNPILATSLPSESEDPDGDVAGFADPPTPDGSRPGYRVPIVWTNGAWTTLGQAGLLEVANASRRDNDTMLPVRFYTREIPAEAPVQIDNDRRIAAVAQLQDKVNSFDWESSFVTSLIWQPVSGSVGPAPVPVGRNTTWQNNWTWDFTTIFDWNGMVASIASGGVVLVNSAQGSDYATHRRVSAAPSNYQNLGARGRPSSYNFATSMGSSFDGFVCGNFNSSGVTPPYAVWTPGSVVHTFPLLPNPGGMALPLAIQRLTKGPGSSAPDPLVVLDGNGRLAISTHWAQPIPLGITDSNGAAADALDLAATTINTRGEILWPWNSILPAQVSPRLWRNGRLHFVNNLLHNTTWTVSAVHHLNNHGVILATASSPPTPGVKPVLLLPVDLAVDANRDGTIASGETATQEKPFRFWINNDDDPYTLGQDVEEAMKVDELSPPQFIDWNSAVATGHIDGVRDLEDFTRLHLTLPSDIIDKAKAGEAQIGFKWTGGSGPRIRVYKAQGEEGDEKYLFYKYEANLQVDSTHRSAVLDVKGTQTAFLPSSYWQNVAAGSSKPHFIFEGCEKGTAKLAIVIKFGSSPEAEGTGVWIKLMDVQEMFERGQIAPPSAEPGDTPDPWATTEPLIFHATSDPNGNPPDRDPDGTKQYIIHVHGWRMGYAERQTWANTTFKRLWHLGYKGRYAFFSWPTFSDVTDPWTDGYLSYNKSEYRAWLSGVALKSYVESLPSGYTKNIMAHSMGNVVVGSAFRKGMGGIDNYVLFNAAMAAQSYDPARVDYPTRQTPDTDSVPTVQTNFGLSGKFSGITARVKNFYLEDDNALIWWDRNHLINKPQGTLTAPVERAYGYSSSGWTINGMLHKLAQMDPIILTVPLRGVTMTEEAMDYVSKTRSIAAGRTPTKLGFTSGWMVDLDARDFGDEHSAMWIWSLQRTFGNWRELLYAFDIIPNPIP